MSRPAGRGATTGFAARIERWEKGEFPRSIYLEGPAEAIKTALLAELKRAWLAHNAGAPPSVFRAAEAGVDKILAAYQSTSLFNARELVIVLDVEDLGRSEKRVSALAGGIEGTGGGSCLVLVESAGDTVRKSLDPLRAVCADHVIAAGLTRAELKAWGERSFARENVAIEAGAIQAIVDACEGDPLSYFNELQKLAGWAGDGGRITVNNVTDLLRPVVGADLPEFLSAVALGNPALASQRLGRLLAAGAGEGAVLFALSNLVGGAMGGWARWRELSDAYRRRVPPRELNRALDAVYRAESAWKGGRADVVALLEQTTRALSGTK